MKSTYLKNIGLYVILLIPVFAYLDTILVANNTFEGYLYICSFEGLKFMIGLLTGIKIYKNMNKDSNTYDKEVLYSCLYYDDDSNTFNKSICYVLEVED